MSGIGMTVSGTVVSHPHATFSHQMCFSSHQDNAPWGFVTGPCPLSHDLLTVLSEIVGSSSEWEWGPPTVSLRVALYELLPRFSLAEPQESGTVQSILLVPRFHLGQLFKSFPSTPQSSLLSM